MSFDPDDECPIQISNYEGLLLFHAAEIPMRQDPTWSIAKLVPWWAQQLRQRLPPESSRIAVLRAARDPEIRRAVFALVASFGEYPDWADWEERQAMVAALDAYLEAIGAQKPFQISTTTTVP